jgi:hypothetical protein
MGLAVKQVLALSKSLTSNCQLFYSALLFSIDPLTYVSRTIVNADAVCFAPGEKFHAISINERDLLQVQSNSIRALLMVNFLSIQKSLDLLHVLDLDSAGQTEDDYSII